MDFVGCMSVMAFVFEHNILYNRIAIIILFTKGLYQYSVHLDRIRGRHQNSMAAAHIQQPAAANLNRTSYSLLLNAAAFWLQPAIKNLRSPLRLMPSINFLNMHIIGVDTLVSMTTKTIELLIG